MNASVSDFCNPSYCYFIINYLWFICHLRQLFCTQRNQESYFKIYSEIKMSCHYTRNKVLFLIMLNSVTVSPSSIQLNVIHLLYLVDVIQEIEKKYMHRCTYSWNCLFILELCMNKLSGTGHLKNQQLNVCVRTSFYSTIHARMLIRLIKYHPRLNQTWNVEIDAKFVLYIARELVKRCFVQTHYCASETWPPSYSSTCAYTLWHFIIYCNTPVWSLAIIMVSECGERGIQILMFVNLYTNVEF